jgi:hypothetical protein
MDEKKKLALQLAATLTSGMFPGQVLGAPETGKLTTMAGVQADDVVKRWRALIPMVEAALDELDPPD